MAEEYPFDYNPEKYLPKNSYRPCHLRATQRYREKNREKYNAYMKNYHLKKMRTDMDYRNRRAKSNEKALKKRKKRIEEAKQAKQIHDEKIMNIVKEETGIDEELDNVIKYDQL